MMVPPGFIRSCGLWDLFSWLVLGHDGVVQISIAGLCLFTVWSPLRIATIKCSMRQITMAWILGGKVIKMIDKGEQCGGDFPEAWIVQKLRENVAGKQFSTVVLCFFLPDKKELVERAINLNTFLCLFVNQTSLEDTVAKNILPVHYKSFTFGTESSAHAGSIWCSLRGMGINVGAGSQGTDKMPTSDCSYWER